LQPVQPDLALRDYVFGRWFEANFGEQRVTVQSVAHFSELEEVIEFVGRRAGWSIVAREADKSFMPG
jgi:hypothetical protein